MQKRAAIALSLNFLVIIIIAIVILGLSSVLFSDIFKKVQDVDVELQEEYKREIWKMLDTGAKVVAPLGTQEVERGELASFGVGVRNILDTTQDFSINVVPQDVGGCLGSEHWLLIPRQTREIDVNSQDIFTIGVKVPKNTRPCVFVFDVNVTNSTGTLDRTQYGTLQKLNVVVK